ncbi:MAG TPA: hypothetical protein VJH22_04435 [Candidatus Nanoarchaeia archaeon]|nr:hypothetical protein [Candidatus Nanoarchaeia archaeon]
MRQTALLIPAVVAVLAIVALVIVLQPSTQGAFFGPQQRVMGFHQVFADPVVQQYPRDCVNEDQVRVDLCNRRKTSESIEVCLREAELINQMCV